MNESNVINNVPGVSIPELPKINTISLEDPWRWLTMGWKDLLAAPQFSLPYGAVFVVISYLLVWALLDGDMFFLFPLLAAGFFLFAPILGLGLYGISRSLEQNQAVEFCELLKSWRSNPVHISAVGLILMMIMLAWIFTAVFMFAVFLNNPIINWDEFLAELVFSGEHTVFLILGGSVGAAIAMFTFCISVVTVPMLIDRQTDFMTAMRTSVKAVKVNFKPLMLWAYLIVMMVSLSFMTYFVALIVIMPVLGHATWHAYRDLVQSD